MARPRNLRFPLVSLTAAIAFAAAQAAACVRLPPPLVLATTTSVGNSGLLDRILPDYRDETVRPLLVGSGRALAMLAAGEADVVISHAPARETEALRAHPTWQYRKILFNDFLIVGPAEDPAGVRAASDAADAMRRIAGSTARFISRGDDSGTHQRERELWSAAGMTPDSQRLVVAGAGMGQTLRIAGETGAYTLTDRGTHEALSASVRLVVLLEGDPRLLNTYAVVADPANARGLAFARWLWEGEGREVVRRALTSGGVRGFSVWPSEVLGSTPSALPR